MKTYFIGLLLLMTGFTGFLFLKRPGAFQELMSTTKISPSLLSFKDTKKEARKSSKAYPYFSFISGDVVLNTEAQSYLAQINIELRLKDKIMVSFNSFAILALGPEKFLRLGEGTKITYEERPRRRRGFFEFKLEKGRIFSDIFANKEPIGLKIHFGEYSLSMQDATVRLQTKANGQFLSSMDRGSSQFYLPTSAEVHKFEAGFGAHNKEGALKIGEFDWIDDYPWQRRINAITKQGYGVAATFKATPLSKRPAKVNQQDAAVSWKKQNTAAVKRKPSKTIGNISKMLNKVGKKAGEGLKKVITAPTKITESRENIKNFEKIQKQKARVLDSIE